MVVSDGKRGIYKEVVREIENDDPKMSTGFDI